ncbi:MAG: tyrosine decarboxylase MfnA [Promethearchaeota archaeon]|nr:MAG: tyrosine decarboxylase MfnA [Candidatus Lokiarchaeota archaeon]
MLRKGLTKREILNILKQKLAKDQSYESGFILGSMCTEPLNFGKEIYKKYISKNLGDPGLFQGSAEIENDLIKEIGVLFGGSNIVGAITSGGSEANLIAMHIAKKLKQDIKSPEFIVPKSAHMSFDKGQELMSGGVKLIKANLTEEYKLDLNHLESLINENTCGVVGIAGTTSLGVVDPIKEIGKIIEQKDIFFHVDAAFGGFVLPFLKELNYNVPPWDFNVKEVDSITADPHKMGLGIIPTGGFFLRDGKILSDLGFEIPYLAGGNFKHFNLIGTRPGAQVIAFWATLKFLGFEGYSKIIKECMLKTEFLAQQISEIKGIKLAAKPEMNIVGITTENGDNICDIDEELRKRKWMLGKFMDLNLIRIVVMPHVTKKHLELFISDLEDVLKKLKFN